LYRIGELFTSLTPLNGGVEREDWELPLSMSFEVCIIVVELVDGKKKRRLDWLLDPLRNARAAFDVLRARVTASETFFDSGFSFLPKTRNVPPLLLPLNKFFCRSPRTLSLCTKVNPQRRISLTICQVNVWYKTIMFSFCIISLRSILPTLAHTHLGPHFVCIFC
jgi:hypothetical protein